MISEVLRHARALDLRSRRNEILGLAFAQRLLERQGSGDEEAEVVAGRAELRVLARVLQEPGDDVDNDPGQGLRLGIDNAAGGGDQRRHAVRTDEL
eukprot:8359665-Alexandrium_andersonii.AAC.1